MDSKRQLKFSRLIQKELAEIFQRDTKSLFGNTFITVTHAQISPDLSVAKVYLSVMLSPNKEETLNFIRANVKIIRNHLSQKIRKDVRIIPELVFYLDDSADYASKMDKVLKDLNIPKEDQSDTES